MIVLTLEKLSTARLDLIEREYPAELDAGCCRARTRADRRRRPTRRSPRRSPCGRRGCISWPSIEPGLLRRAKSLFPCGVNYSRSSIIARSNGWFASSGASHTVEAWTTAAPAPRASASSPLVPAITLHAGSGTGTEASSGSRLPSLAIDRQHGAVGGAELERVLHALDHVRAVDHLCHAFPPPRSGCASPPKCPTT